MRPAYCLATALLVTGLAACNDPAANTPPASIAAQTRATSGIVTAQPAQAELKVSGGQLVPLLTTGDLLPGSNLPWAPTPDGLGAYRDGDDIVVFANHEITSSGVTSSNGGAPFQSSRVSRLRIDPFTLHITSGDFALDGTAGYIRLCSATWAGAEAGRIPAVFEPDTLTRSVPLNAAA